MVVAFFFWAISFGQDPALDLRRTLTADTSRVAKRARSAQAAFERERLQRLPTSGREAGRCDERIGRYCYWYDKSDTTLPPEPAEIKRARHRLLVQLDDARRERPGSDWITGQEIRYLVEHGWADSAVRIGAGCAGTPWWCRALAGYGSHAAGRYPEADSLFAQAIREMPRALYCRWTDWSKLFEGRLYDRFHPLDCDARARFADSVFALAQPLMSRPGNDLRTELLARRVISALIGSARAPEQWNEDLDEVGLRYGWPTRWTIAESFYPSQDGPSIIGHDRAPAAAFFPTLKSDSAAPWIFELDADRPRFRYAPAYAVSFATIEGYQIAQFPRGDSTIVVAAATAPSDSAFRAGPVSYGLAVLADGPDPFATSRTDSAPERSGTSTDRIAVPGSARLVSIEVWSGRQVARVRRSVPPLDRSGGLSLSTPLLFRAGDELPASLEDAARRALPTTTISRSSLVGVYWEAGGIGADSIDVSITVVPVRRGLMGRIGEGLSLVHRRGALTLAWRAGAEAGGVEGRAVELDLKQQPPGKYQLRLDARTPDGRTAATVLPLELRP
jgi:hypothetical protein